MSTCVWEPESALPPRLIEEYNNGVQRELIEEVHSSGGKHLHHISSQPLSNTVKRPRLETLAQNYEV